MTSDPTDSSQLTLPAAPALSSLLEALPFRALPSHGGVSRETRKGYFHSPDVRRHSKRQRGHDMV